jgi:hypothetical protein
MGSIPSGGGSGPPPGSTGQVVDSPSGPLYVWYEMNSMGVLVERVVPYAYIQSSYRSGRDHRLHAPPEGNAVDQRDLHSQRSTQREREQRVDHSKSRLTDRRNTNNVDNNSTSKRLKTDANGNGAGPGISKSNNNIEIDDSNKSS